MVDYMFKPDVNDTSRDWGAGGTWTGGVVPDAPDADVIIPTTTVIADGSIFLSTIQVDAQVFDIRSLTMANNNLVLQGNAAQTPTGLNVSGAVNLSTGAQLNMVYATLNAGTIVSNGAYISGLSSTINTQSMTNSATLVGSIQGLTINAAQFTNTGDVAGGVTIHTDAGGYSGLQGGDLSGGSYIAQGDIHLNVGDVITSTSSDISLWNGSTIFSYDDSSGAYLSLGETLEDVPEDVSLSLVNGFPGFTATYDFAHLNVGGTLQLSPEAAGSQMVLSGNVHILEGGTLEGQGIVTAALTNDGLVQANATQLDTSLVLEGPITGNGSLAVGQSFNLNEQAILDIRAATDQDVAFQSSGGQLILGDVYSFTGTLSASTYSAGVDPYVGNLITLDGIDYAQISDVTYLANSSGGTLSFNQASGTVTLNFSGNFDRNSFEISDGRTLSSDPAKTNITVHGFVCFVTGTRIRTDRGDIAVEALAIGDRAITASGEARPITWIGRRTLSDIGDPAEEAAWPVRVAAGAFGPQMPDRDLLLSAGHAVCVDMMGQVFIPVGRLVNGATIARVPMEAVTYWHVELDSHDVLLSNNLPTESYLDVGNRAWFGGAGEDILPSGEDISGYARPFVDSGPIVEAARLQLAARASSIGWRDTADMDLHLVVDGRRVDGDSDGDLARFIFPADACDVRLLSHCFVPAHGQINADSRALGIGIVGLALSDGLRAEQSVALDDPLFDGQHAVERHGGQAWRWTKGELPLDPALWSGFRSHVILRIDLIPSGGRRWVAPMPDCATADLAEAKVVMLHR